MRSSWCVLQRVTVRQPESQFLRLVCCLHGSSLTEPIPCIAAPKALRHAPWSSRDGRRQWQWNASQFGNGGWVPCSHRRSAVGRHRVAAARGDATCRLPLPSLGAIAMETVAVAVGVSGCQCGCSAGSRCGGRWRSAGADRRQQSGRRNCSHAFTCAASQAAGDVVTAAAPAAAKSSGRLSASASGAGGSAGGLRPAEGQLEPPPPAASHSEVIFLGTGTSEGIPRVSCLTDPKATCQVSGRAWERLGGCFCMELLGGYHWVGSAARVTLCGLQAHLCPGRKQAAGSPGSAAAHTVIRSHREAHQCNRWQGWSG